MTTRQPLDRDQIVAAALTVVDDVGVDGLSMRRLAAELGVAPMSLYRHVEDKDELLGLLVEAVVGQVRQPDAGEHWANSVATAVRSVRRVLLAHPGVASLLLTDRSPRAPAVLRAAESVLESLHAAGLDETEAARAFTTLWVHTVGMALIEQSLSEAGAGPPQPAERERPARTMGAAAGPDYPRLATAADRWAAGDEDDAFEAGLALILDGIRARAGE